MLGAAAAAAAQRLAATPFFASPRSPSSSSSLQFRHRSALWPKASHDRDFPPASRIFVRNLSYSISESSLKSAFSDFGQIIEVKLARDGDTKKSKGYGFLQYSCQDDAILAMEHMDGKIIDGRAVFVEIAKPINKEYSGYPISSGPPQQNQDSRRSSDLTQLT